MRVPSEPTTFQPLGLSEESRWSTALLAIATAVVWSAFIVRFARSGLGDHLIGSAVLARPIDIIVIVGSALIAGIAVLSRRSGPEVPSLWRWIAAGIGLPVALSDDVVYRQPWLGLGFTLLTLPAIIHLAGCRAVAPFTTGEFRWLRTLKGRAWPMTIALIAMTTLFFFESYLTTLSGRNGLGNWSGWAAGWLRYWGPIADPVLPLSLQSFALSAAAVPLFSLTNTLTSSRCLAFAVATLYLLHPAVHMASLQGFSISNLLPVTLFTAVMLMNQSRRWIPELLLMASTLILPACVGPASVVAMTSWRGGRGVLTTVTMLMTATIATFLFPSTPPPPSAGESFRQSLLPLAFGVTGLAGLPLLSRKGCALIITFVASTWITLAFWPCELVERASGVAAWSICMLAAVCTLRNKQIGHLLSPLPTLPRSQLIFAAIIMSGVLSLSVVFIPWRGFFFEGLWRIENARHQRLTSRVPPEQLDDWQLTTASRLPRPAGTDRFASMDEVLGFRIWRRCHGVAEPDPLTQTLWPRSLQEAPRIAPPCGTR